MQKLARVKKQKKTEMGFSICQVDTRDFQWHRLIRESFYWKIWNRKSNEFTSMGLFLQFAVDFFRTCFVVCVVFKSQSNQSDWQISKVLCREKKWCTEMCEPHWYQKRIGNSLISIYWWVLKWYKPFGGCPLKQTTTTNKKTHH